MINHDNITFDTLDLTSTIAKIQGEVTKGPYYSHEAYGECFYKMQVICSHVMCFYIHNSPLPL